MRSDYKHWKNSQELGATLFVTATCLDFAHLFARPELREFMSRHILQSHLDLGARLHSFVVMTHHFHTISSAPKDRTCSWLVQKIKEGATKQMRGQLNQSELDQLKMQAGLNERQMWKRSFRGIPIKDERMIGDTSQYIHWNPVRAGFCEEPLQYRWSSSRLFEKGLYVLEQGFDLERCLAEFEA